MKRIKITENDLKKMIMEGVIALMEMETFHPEKKLKFSIDASEFLSQVYQFGEPEEIEEILSQAGLPSVIPFELYFPGGKTGAGPDDYWGKIEVLNKTQLNSILQKAEALITSRSETSELFHKYQLLIDEATEISDFEELEGGRLAQFMCDTDGVDTPSEPDPDSLPGGHDYGKEFGDINEDAPERTTPQSYSFNTQFEFERAVENFNLPLHIFDAYLTHSDIGLLDRPLHVVFYPGAISECEDGNIKVDDVSFEYGDDERCSVDGKLEILKVGKISWLDKAVSEFTNKHKVAILQRFSN